MSRNQVTNSRPIPEERDAAQSPEPSTAPAFYQVLNCLCDDARGVSGRRITRAHELCHLLFDRSRLRSLARIEGRRAESDRLIEMRANAFAVEPLVPMPTLIGDDGTTLRDDELPAKAFGRGVSVAAFEEGDEARFWRSNIYVPIDYPHVFENPLSATDSKKFLALTPGGALTPLNGQAFRSLKDKLAKQNGIPDFLAEASPGRLGFRNISHDNWIEIACSNTARFIDESQVRSYLADFLLERLKDRRTAIHQECRCEVTESRSCFADYFACIGGIWVPIEAKLNVRSERDLFRQVSRYLGVPYFSPTRGAATNERIVGPGASYCLVIDSHGLYLANEEGFVQSSANHPLLARTAISDTTIGALRRQLLEMNASLH